MLLKMPVRIAINGFGRIGRAAFKLALEHQDADLVAINDLGDIHNLVYLLKYDSVYGRYGREVAAADGELVAGGDRVAVLSEPEPAKLPWKDMAVDVVIESTGVFTEKEKAYGHIKAGTKHVIISAPTKSEEVSTVVLGVNDDKVKGRKIVSNASCTTNCAASVAAVMENAFGVEKALLTTAHAYTATQSLVDGPNNKDLRRGRAAAVNMVPAATGAAVATTKAMPQLEGKFDGVALRVPLPVVSICDFSFLLKRGTTVEEVRQAFKEAAENPIYRGVIAVTEEPVVSSDFIGDPHSAVVDLPMTRVVGGDLVKVMAWYDNEWGYSNRLVEAAIKMAGQ